MKDIPEPATLLSRCSRGHEVFLGGMLAERFGADPFNLLEIGVWSGQTALYLLRRFPAMSYVGVDPYVAFDCAPQADVDLARSLAWQRLGDLPMASWLWQTGHAYAKTIDLDWMFDAVFIDGEHSTASTLQDMYDWWPRTRRLLIGHDYNGDSVSAAVRAFAYERGLAFKSGDNFWWIDRP